MPVVDLAHAPVTVAHQTCMMRFYRALQAISWACQAAELPLSAPVAAWPHDLHSESLYH